MDKEEPAAARREPEEMQSHMTNGRTKTPSFVIVYDFMMKELDLSGIELLLYARIFGFSAAGRDFYESKGNTAKYFNASARSIFSAYSALERQGLVKQTKPTGKTESKRYKIRKDALPEGIRNNLQAYGWAAYEETAYEEAAYAGSAREKPPPYAEMPQPLMQVFHPIIKEDNKDIELKGGP